MKDIKEIYPDRFKYPYDAPYDYHPMLNEIGRIVVQVDDDDYQGDSRVLYDNDGAIGYLNFGWGSCSGCDALRGSESYEELQLLFDQLKNDTKWFSSAQEALHYFNEKDWSNEYSWHYDEQKEFLKKVTEYLKNRGDT